jgi:hypothetical protein
MNHYVGGTKRKYALDKPVVSEIWLVQAKTNLTQDEIKFIEKVGFVLNKQQWIYLNNLFKGENSIPLNRLVDDMSWPTSHNGKVVCWIVPFNMSNLHYNQWEAS